MTEYLTPEQAEQVAPYFKADWYRRQLCAGTLRGSKVGGRWFIERSSIDALVEAGSNDPARSPASTRRRRRRAA